ncbi:hypothetical protein [Croceivirga radicis]|uniref:hypothetical protein n=1 Tax=Croceivirga radicis TaxID=1929488 RepID=UPI0011410D33|nr:hypothetical protein [Croceivirga radicis]
MRKLLVLYSLLFFVFSCKDQEDTGANETDKPVAEFTFKSMPVDVELSDAAREELKNWKTYDAFENSFAVFKKSRNTEDLKLAVADLLEKEARWAKDTFPEPYDNNQIKSRQTILRNFLLKTKGYLEMQEDVKEPIKEVLVARNALRNHFNRIARDTIDIKLLLNGE